MSLERPCTFLCINPPSPDGAVYIRDINRSGRRSRERTIWPQTSLAYLAAVAKMNGFSVNLVDCIASEYDWEDVHNYIRREKPVFVLVQAVSSTMTNDAQATYLGKRYGAKTILVGPHVTALPEKTLECYPTVDFGLIGECEETLDELLKCLYEKGDPAKVAGIVLRQDGVPRRTAPRPFIADLDTLPMPLHELLPIEKYSLPFIGKRYTFVLHSRGCPAACHYCRQTVMWKSKQRYRSPRLIVDELEHLTRMDVNNIMFHADTFTMDHDNVVAICKEIINRKLDVRWICNGRVDCIDPVMLDWMKKAGCWMINYGLESGVDAILQACNKGTEATAQMGIDAVLMTKKAGIKVWGYFMIGLPGETRETIRQTLDYAKKLPLDIVNFSVAAPYPGTAFYRQAVRKGWIVENTEWEDLDQNYSAVVNYPDLSNQEIIRAVRYCFLSWYLRPRGIWAVLKGMTRWGYMMTILRVALNHLKIGRETKAGRPRGWLRQLATG